MYADDPRTWSDLICDEAPPLPAAVRAAIQQATSAEARAEARPESLLALLLASGEFTAELAAKQHGCWESSVRGTLRAHRDRFVQVRARHGNAPAVWRAKRAGE